MNKSAVSVRMSLASFSALVQASSGGNWAAAIFADCCFKIRINEKLFLLHCRPNLAVERDKYFRLQISQGHHDELSIKENNLLQSR